MPGGSLDFERRGSSGGQSTRLIIVVSRVQVPPPLPAPRHDQAPRNTTEHPATLCITATTEISRRGKSVASKSTDIRPKITMACTECKERNYITRKNRRNDPDRMELKKYCPRCRTHTPHRETR